MSQILLPTEFDFPAGRRVINQDGSLGGNSPYPGEWKTPNFWKLRENLLSVRDTTAATWFLNRSGYAVVVVDESISMSGLQGHNPRFIRWPVKPEAVSGQLLQFLIRWRDIIRQMMLLPTARWDELQDLFGPEAEYFAKGTGRHHAERSVFRWNEAGFPSIKVFLDDALEAIVMTVHIDKLRKIHFRTCRRTDCDVVFALRSKHNKIFCSYDCAHLVAVRKSRKRTRSTLQKGAK